ncbi:hypothetical protein AB0469_35145 [Streptomyces sp. NPDC093801]|uniref:hypothetical protein n=1 Tax=Streptomyces sp. NPDC093801 TaxID=3155203 RepID=UPI00344CAE6A
MRNIMPVPVPWNSIAPLDVVRLSATPHACGAWLAPYTSHTPPTASTGRVSGVPSKSPADRNMAPAQRIAVSSLRPFGACATGRGKTSYAAVLQQAKHPAS